MVLVCGSTGMSAEELKVLRWIVNKIGFHCRLGKNGWYYFTQKDYKKGNIQWGYLKEYLLQEPSLVMLFYLLDNDTWVISLDYMFKLMFYSSKEIIGLLVLQGLRSFVKISIKQWISYILRIKEKNK